MFAFNSKFQQSVKFHEIATFSLHTLALALEQASNHQFPVNPTKVGAIVKSLVKGELLVAPKLAFITGEPEVLHIVSGRHRVSAIKQFVEQYGVKADGKVVAITEAKKENVDRIEGTVECCVYEVPNLATLGALMMAENGSRSMSSAERAVVKLRGAVATPGEMLKVRISNIFITAIPQLTAPTAMSIAAKLTTAVKGIKSATNETIEGIAETFSEYMTENPKAVPSNLARDYGLLVDAVFSLTMVYEDNNGDEITDTYLNYLNYAIPVVTKEKASKTKESAAVVTEMMKQIAELQQELQAVRARG